MKKILTFIGFIALVFVLAGCKPKIFTVTFDSNGGTNVAAEKVEANKKATKPTSDPTKDGFTFVEWQLDGAKYEFETPVTRDITLKALWRVNEGDPIMETLEDIRDTLGVLIKDPKNILVGFNLPTKFMDDVVGVWKSSDTTYFKIGEPDTSGVVTTTVIRPESAEGNKVVKLSVVLSLEGKSVNWEIELTIIALEPAAYEGNSFKEGVTKELANETIKVSNVALYYAQGTNGYYLSTADGSLAFVYGTTGMPEAGKLYNITAKVENYYNALQIKDVNYQLVEGTPDHVVTYADFSIADAVLLPKPSAEHVYGHNAYKFKDVKIFVEGTGNYNTFLVDKDFDPTKDKRTKDNSVMFYYPAQINELRALQGLVINEIDLVFEGYRTDHNVWYFSYLKPIADIKLATLTDQEKADAAKNGLSIVLEFPKAGKLELPKTGIFESTITWTYKESTDPNNNLINLENGEVTLPTEPGRKVVTIVATIINGTGTATKEFDIKVGEYVLETIEDALLLENGETIMVEGIITDKFANNTYGFQSGSASIAIYFFDELVIGKKYRLIGEKDNFNGLHQLKNIEVVESSSGLIPEPFAINDIIDNSEELANYIAGRVSIEGAEVIAVGELSGNNRDVKIKKGETELIIKYDKRVFGGADSTVLAGLKVGDIINYVGNLGWYKAPQLGFGPNTYVGEGWPTPDFEFVTTIDFGGVAVTGYGDADKDFIQEKTFTNGDGVSYSITLKRGQINKWNPNAEKPNYLDYVGGFVVLAPINTATESYFELDLGNLAGMTELKMSLGTWSTTAFNKISGFEDAKIALQLWDGETWVTLKDIDNKENVISYLKDGEFTPVTFKVEGPGKYRVLYDAPSAASGNTTQALTIDDIIVKGKAVEKEIEASEYAGFMIYEIYGGGGNTGAVYKNDYVVLYNGTSLTIDMTQFSLHYASKAGDFKKQEGLTYDANIFLTGTLEPGKFYVIQLGAGTGGTEDLPIVANFVGGITAAATDGKFALVKSNDKSYAISGKNDILVVDFVGFGTEANMYEGSGPTAKPSNTNSVRRKSLVDNNDNATDFEVVVADLSYLLN